MKKEYCKFCGTEIKSKSNFCESCGKNLGNKLGNKNRPTFLNVWLIIMLISSIFGAIINIAVGQYFFFLLSGLMFLFIGALYKWKLWGFYGIVFLSIISFVVNIQSGLGLISFFGFIGVLILYLAMKPVWGDFK